MFRVGNKIVKIGNKLPISVNNTIIELTVRGTSFPDRNTGAFRVASSVLNTMYIDFADGTGITEFPLIVGSNEYINIIMHYYQDLADPSKINTIDKNYPQQRTIKMWFKFPVKITFLSFGNFGLYGSFPANIGNYNLSELNFSNNEKIENFPQTLGGLKITLVNLSNIADIKLNYFPSWIGNSQITILTLVNNFNFEGVDSSVTGFDNVANVKGMSQLNISANNLITNAEFPVLKNCIPLRTLSIGNPFTTFPDKIGECAQITTLNVSQNTNLYDSPNFTNWGNGIGLMTSLVTLNFEKFNSNNGLTTDLPLGMANCVNLKTFNSRGWYSTQPRLDTFINNVYDFIIANASTTTGNTKFRQMRFDSGNYIGLTVPRPSGNYADEDSPMGKIWRMVNIYKHTWIVRSIAGPNETLS